MEMGGYSTESSYEARKDPIKDLSSSSIHEVREVVADLPRGPIRDLQLQLQPGVLSRCGDPTIVYVSSLTLFRRFLTFSFRDSAVSTYAVTVMLVSTQFMGWRGVTSAQMYIGNLFFFNFLWYYLEIDPASLLHLTDAAQSLG